MITRLLPGYCDHNRARATGLLGSERTALPDPERRPVTTIFDPAPTAVTFTVAVEGTRLHVTVSGELDLACTDTFDALFDLDTAGIHSVVLHLGAMTFCDVTGLNALDGFQAYHCGAGRTVHLLDVLPQVRRHMALLEAISARLGAVLPPEPRAATAGH